MSNPKGKQAFAPAQAVAAVSALDFAATAEAFRVSLAHDKPGVEVTDHADMIAERADRVVSTPAHTPAQIAEKLTAYAWLHGLPHDFANPATQAAIAHSNRDDAKGLLAIYLDLTATPDRSEWDAAVARYEAARDASYAADERNADDEECDALHTAEIEALEALAHIRTPDAAALAYRTALVIDRLHTEYADDNPNDPASISRMLGAGWEETWAAALHQDALYLNGDRSPVVFAKPDPFNAADWLSETERATGSTLTMTDDGRGFTFEGGDHEEATRRLSALHIAHTRMVSTEAWATRSTRQPMLSPEPMPQAEREAIFARAILNVLSPEKRETVRAALESVGVQPEAFQ